jgi:hypothetical protein
MSVTARPQKITLGEMRQSGIHSLLVYCADCRCSQSRSTLIGGQITSGCPIWSRVSPFLLRRTLASSTVNFRKCFGWREIVTHAQFRSRVVKPMTIYRLLKDTAFGPEDIERLVMAYEQTLRALRLKDRNDPITQLVAEKIIAIGRLGIEDPAEISKLALKQLGPP